jgi:CRISPR/Cas system CSM-associated protein Csm2 small subunit
MGQVLEKAHEPADVQDQNQGTQHAKKQVKRKNPKDVQTLLDASEYTQKFGVSHDLLEIVKEWLAPSLQLNMVENSPEADMEFLRLLNQLKSSCTDYLNHPDVKSKEELQKEVNDIIELVAIITEGCDLHRTLKNAVQTGDMSEEEADQALDDRLDGLGKRQGKLGVKNEKLNRLYSLFNEDMGEHLIKADESGAAEGIACVDDDQIIEQTEKTTDNHDTEDAEARKKADAHEKAMAKVRALSLLDSYLRAKKSHVSEKLKRVLEDFLYAAETLHLEEDTKPHPKTLAEPLEQTSPPLESKSKEELKLERYLKALEQLKEDCKVYNDELEAQYEQTKDDDKLTNREEHRELEDIMLLASMHISIASYIKLEDAEEREEQRGKANRDAQIVRIMNEPLVELFERSGKLA